MTKALLPLIFAVEQASFVTLVVSCKRGNLEGGRGVFLYGLQTLMLLYKAIAFSLLKPNELDSSLGHFLFRFSLVSVALSIL
jgi:hypothetical protein